MPLSRLAKKREATIIEEAVKKSVVGHHDAVDLAADVQIPSLSAESEQETTAEKQPSDTILDNAMARLARVKALILRSSRYFPFTIPDESKTSWKICLKEGLDCNTVVERITLGFVKFSVEIGKTSVIRCLLHWVEPFLWFMLQTRWTVQHAQQLPGRDALPCRG